MLWELNRFSSLHFTGLKQGKDPTGAPLWSPPRIRAIPINRDKVCALKATARKSSSGMKTNRSTIVFTAHSGSDTAFFCCVDLKLSGTN